MATNPNLTNSIPIPVIPPAVNLPTITLPNYIPQQVKQELTWLQKHERIVLAVIVVMAVLALGNKVINWRADHDKLVAVAADQQLTAQKTANAQLAQQVSQMQQQYSDLQKAISAQNAALLSAISARDAALAQQQQKDTSLPIPALVERWQQLVPTGSLSVTPNGVTADDAAAHATVNALEQVPVLTQNLADQTKIADGKQQEIDKANSTITGLNAQVSGLYAQSKDQDVACKAQIAQVKAEARKSKRNWFLRGFALGAGVAAAALLHGI